MEILIATVLVALGFTFFATQNTGMVSVYLGSYLLSIPVYLLALSSLLLGLLISWIISLFSSLDSFLSIQGKESKIQEKDLAISDLKRRLSSVGIENSRLREQVHNANVQHRTDAWNRFKENFGWHKKVAV